MATPEQTTSAEPDLKALFNCETPRCPNVYRVISMMVGDSTSHYHCWACWMGWNTAIINGLVEQGLITMPEPTGS